MNNALAALPPDVVAMPSHGRYEIVDTPLAGLTEGAETKMTNAPKVLSSIPFPPDDRLRVRSLVTGAEGVVIQTRRDPGYKDDDVDGQVTVVDWDYGKQSTQRHYQYDKVEVIE